MPLLRSYAAATGGKPLGKATGRPDIVFEDFEHGYEKWKVEGTAFGTKPAARHAAEPAAGLRLPGQGLVNSSSDGDDTTGRLVSKPFTIERNFIRFLVGGGAHRDTQIRLVRRRQDRSRRPPAATASNCCRPSGTSAEFDGQDRPHRDRRRAEGPLGPHQRGPDRVLRPGRRPAPPWSCSKRCCPRGSATFAVRESVPPGDPNVLEFADLELPRGGQAVEPDEHATGASSPAGQGASGRGLRCDPRPDTRRRCRPRASGRTPCCASWWGPITRRPKARSPKAPGFGTVALATLAPGATLKLAFANWNDAWDEFCRTGRFSARTKAIPLPAHRSRPTRSRRSGPGNTVNTALAATVTVAAGQTVEVPFLLAWHYPEQVQPGRRLDGLPLRDPLARRRGRCCARRRRASPRLRERTEQFRKTFYDSTLPYWLLDCLTSQAAIIRHIGVVFRIANGDVYGWEGSNGCCQPTCTHVWGYEQTPRPALPRPGDATCGGSTSSTSSARTAASTTAPTSPRRRGPPASSPSPTATRAASSRPTARP